MLKINDNVSIYAFLLKVLVQLASFVVDCIFWKLIDTLATSLLNDLKLFILERLRLRITHHDQPFVTENERPRSLLSLVCDHKVVVHYCCNTLQNCRCEYNVNIELCLFKIDTRSRFCCDHKVALHNSCNALDNCQSESWESESEDKCLWSLMSPVCDL